MTQETLVLGGGPIGLEIAAELAARDQPATVVDGAAVVNRAREAGLTAQESTLESATESVDRTASTVVVATPSDARNLLLAAAAPRVFDADRVVAFVNDPERRSAFDAAGVETVCVSQAVATVAVDSVAAEDPTAADRASESSDRVGVSE